MAIPLEERERIVAQVVEEGRTALSVAEEFGVAASTVRKYVRRFRRGDSLERRFAPGAPRKFGPDQMELLRRVTVEQPTASREDILGILQRDHGLRISISTLARYLNELGIERGKPEKSLAPEAPPSGYRYQSRHRREVSATRYPSSMTDAEWEVLQPVIEGHLDARGRPPQYPRRQMLDAMLYVLRSGVPWRMLPREFPPWNTVYKTFRRWDRIGLINALLDRLRDRWRESQGRAAEPTGVIVDSQSTKTTEKGGSADMTAARR